MDREGAILVRYINLKKRYVCMISYFKSIGGEEAPARENVQFLRLRKFFAQASPHASLSRLLAQAQTVTKKVCTFTHFELSGYDQDSRIIDHDHFL